jgi:enolase
MSLTASRADGTLDFEEFMIVQHGDPSFADALRYDTEARRRHDQAS